jgi:HEAT repeat protein
MTRSQFAVGGVVLALLVAGTAWLATSGCNVDRSVTEPHRERNLMVEDIRRMLKSGDFKDRLEAARQIDKLGDDEKVTVLLELAQDPDPAARILAARKLRDLDEPRATEALARLASEDADPDVREAATQR